MGTLSRLLAGLCLTLVFLPAEAASFRIRPVVLAGDPAPGGGQFGGFDEVTLNGRGEVLFEATVGGVEGLYLASDGSIRPLVVLGHPTPLGGRYLGLAFPTLNDAGQAAFLAMIKDGQAPGAILMWSGGRLSVVAAIRDPAPGGGNFKEFRDVTLDHRGQIAFVAAVQGGREPGGVFVRSGDAGKRVAALLGPTPLGGTFMELALPSLDGTRVVFHGKVSGGKGRTGIFEVSANGSRRLVAEGDPAPAGGTFRDLGAPILGRSGSVAFWASTRDGRTPGGLFLATGTGIRQAVARGEPAPRGGAFSFFGLVFSFVESTGIAFQADLSGKGPRRGIFVTGPAGVRAVAVQGDPSPAGGEFQGFGAPSIASTGAVAFVGSSGSRDGIFIAEPLP